MQRLNEFLDQYGIYVFLAFFLLVFIFFIFFWRYQYIKVGRLYAKYEMEKCSKQIAFLSHFAFGYNKQFLTLYDAMVLIAEKQYSLVLPKLQQIHHPKFLHLKAFWECFALICLNENTQAKEILEKNALSIKTQDFQFLEMLLGLKPVSQDLKQKIKNKVLIEYLEAKQKNESVEKGGE